MSSNMSNNPASSTLPDSCPVPPSGRLICRSSQSLSRQIKICGGHAAFLQSYVLGERFGGGGFGHVHHARRIVDNREVVVKEIRSDKVPCWCQVDSQILPIEVVLLVLSQGLPGVVRFLDAFNLGQSWVIVMDRVSDHTCDMFDYIGEQGTLPEPEAAFYFYQLTGILLACHQMGVLHRDIKDENILMNRQTNELVLIDFGSGAFLESRLYTDFDGTRVYCPPEWILTNSYYGKQAEVWSLGVLLYDMLCGDIPFVNDKGITGGKLRYRKDNLSSASKDLIGSCLNMDPSKRPTLLEILRHPWMVLHRPRQHDGLPPSLQLALYVLDQSNCNPEPDLSECVAVALNSTSYSTANSKVPVKSSTLSTPESQHSDSTGVNVPIDMFSTHSSCPSSSPSIYDSDYLESSHAKHPCSTVGRLSHLSDIPLDALDSFPKATLGLTTEQTNASQQLANHICSPSVSHAVSYPAAVSRLPSKPEFSYWSDEDDVLSFTYPFLLRNQIAQPIQCNSSATRLFPKEVEASSISRLHSNGSGSSSGYYSRSDSLSSNEGRHLVATTNASATRTYSTSSYANTVMSVPNVVTAFTTTPPLCVPTTVTTSHSLSRPARGSSIVHSHFWRSGSSSMASSSSSVSSSSSFSHRSTSSETPLSCGVPISVVPVHRQTSSSMFMSTSPNSIVSWPLLFSCHKNMSHIFCSNSVSTSAVTAHVNGSSCPIISSSHPISQPRFPSISNGVDKLCQIFSPLSPTKFGRTQLPVRVHSSFWAGHNKPTEHPWPPS